MNNVLNKCDQTAQQTKTKKQTKGVFHDAQRIMGWNLQSGGQFSHILFAIGAHFGTGPDDFQPQQIQHAARPTQVAEHQQFIMCSGRDGVDIGAICGVFAV